MTNRNRLRRVDWVSREPKKHHNGFLQRQMFDSKFNKKLLRTSYDFFSIILAIQSLASQYTSCTLNIICQYKLREDNRTPLRAFALKQIYFGHASELEMLFHSFSCKGASAAPDEKQLLDKRTVVKT